MEINTQYAGGTYTAYGFSSQTKRQSAYTFATVEETNRADEQKTMVKATYSDSSVVEEFYYRQCNTPGADQIAPSEVKQPQIKDLGVGFVFVGDYGYGMSAGQMMNADSEDVMVQVKITMGQDRYETYEVNLSEVDPKNASAVEMFALCQYADANGTGVESTWGSWHALKEFSAPLGERLEYASLKEAVSKKTDWTKALAQSDHSLEKASTGEILNAADVFKMLKETVLSKSQEIALTGDTTVGISEAENTKECASLEEKGERRTWIITAFGEQGIICKQCTFGGESKELWRMDYKNSGDAQKVWDFIGKFDRDFDLKFAGSKSFWEDFLAGKISKQQENSFFEATFDDIAPNAPDSVRRAWMETAKEVGVNGLKMNHISQLQVQRAMMWSKGDYEADVLGTTVESAIRAIEKAMDSLDHPLTPEAPKSEEVRKARIKEREFYEAFLEKLEAL